MPYLLYALVAAVVVVSGEMWISCTVVGTVEKVE
jgi:hypothetical protein